MLNLPVYLYTPNVRIYLNLAENSYQTVDNMFKDYIKIAKGLKQEIQFSVYNGDQRKTSILGNTLQFNLFKPDSIEPVMTKNLSIIETQNNATPPVTTAKGITKLIINQADTINLEPGHYEFSILKSDGAEWTPLYQDGANTVKGRLELVDGVGVEPIPSTELTFARNNQNGVYYTNELRYKNGDQIHAVYMTGFSGSFEVKVTLEQTLSPTTVWTTIDTSTYINQTGTFPITTSGNYQWIKFEYTPNVGFPSPSGTVDKVVCRY